MVVVNKGKETGSKKAANPSKPDFQAIDASESFQKLVKKKKSFLVTSTILFLGLYILFPLIISYSNVLNGSFVGDVSWTWVYALGLFAMTWILVTVYMKRAAEFDRMANETLKEFNYEEEIN